MERGYRYPEVTSWIRASREDFKLVREIGMKETGILVSCSDYHISDILRHIVGHRPVIERNLRNLGIRKHIPENIRFLHKLYVAYMN